MSDQLKTVFGIDLGTTYSCISYVDEHGKPIIIPNFDNDRLTPSVVFFDDSGVQVGKIAKENAKLYPESVVMFVKREMGNPDFSFEHDGTSYRAEEISAKILKQLVQDAENYLNVQVEDVVISVPAYFGVNEREATRRAGEIAGLNVRHILNEPTAAAITYGMANPNQDSIILVYDLGGGTFDVTIIHVTEKEINVVCTGGDHRLGGKDWDDRIVLHLVERFQQETGRQDDLLKDPDTAQSLMQLAENTKKTLTKRDKAPVSVTHGGEHCKLQLTREEFESLVDDLVQRTLTLTEETLEEARQKGIENIDEVILVGGSTRMPMIEKVVTEKFGKMPKIFDPDEAVAKGAALAGWRVAIGDEIEGRIFAEAGQSGDEIKAESEEKYEELKAKYEGEVAEDFKFTLTAVEAAGMPIRNVTSKSFGVVAINSEKVEKVVNLITKNNTVPIAVTQEFYTEDDNQENVSIRIMENVFTDSLVEVDPCVEIGATILNMPPGLPAMSPLEVTFRLNEEGRLEVTAIEKTENRQVDVTIETASVIDGEELEDAKQRTQNMVLI